MNLDNQRVHITNEVNQDIIDETFLTHASDILGDTRKGLSGGEIIKFSNKFAIKFNIAIPITSSDFGDFGSIVPNKRTALLRNLKAFTPEQQYYVIYELCELSCFNGNYDVEELKNKLVERYSHLSEGKLSDTELIITTKHWLERYTASYNLYSNAIINMEKNRDLRNVLDDMRLSLELLLKDVLSNSKSLENQTKSLGVMLNQRGISKEVRNIFMKVLDYYIIYQNNNIKHDDNVNEIEVKYIIEQTSIMMNFIVETATDN